MPPEVFCVGQAVSRAIYGRPRGASAPVLLLAAGQVIESEQQVRLLREAGYSVSTERQGTSTSTPLVQTREVSPVAAGPLTFSQRLVAAERLRHRLLQASKDLNEKVAGGSRLDLAALDEHSMNVAREVAADPYTVAALTYLRGCDGSVMEHSADVAMLAAAMGKVLELPEDELRLIAMAGLLHDVGTQRIPSELLSKPTVFTPEELEMIRMHPLDGAEILKASGGCPESVLQVTLQHHERLDRSGYPFGVGREALHPHTLIISVADVFSALLSPRPHREALSARQGVVQVYAARGTQLDARAVDALVKLVGVYPVGTRVRLSTGELAEVSAPNPEDSSRPVVQIQRDPLGRSLPFPITVELAKAECSIQSVESGAAFAPGKLEDVLP